jgi:hypothetical protein
MDNSSDKSDFDEENEQKQLIMQNNNKEMKQTTVGLTIDKLGHLNNFSAMEKVQNFLINNPLC